jgi:hypothetical protein
MALGAQQPGRALRKGPTVPARFNASCKATIFRAHAALRLESNPCISTNARAVIRRGISRNSSRWKTGAKTAENPAQYGAAAATFTVISAI